MKEVPEENTNTGLLFYVDQDFKSKNSGAWLSNVKKTQTVCIPENNVKKIK